MKIGEIEKLSQELVKVRNEQELLTKRIDKLEHEISIYVTNKLDNNNSSFINDSVNKPNQKAICEEETTQSEQILDNSSKTKRNLELRIGGTWLNRIGIIAVILGIAFFLKYSFDNQWIGPIGRILFGICAGLVMIVTGEKLHKRYSGYAQGLLGGGSLTLFFSIYAAYEFYELISPTPAFLFLLLVMVNTVFMSIRHNSLPIGILGIVGSYTIPFIIGINEPTITLFSYLTILTAGVLGVSVYKKWIIFQYLSFLFNQLAFLFIWLEYFLWSGFNQYFMILLVYIICNFALYLCIATVYNIRKKKKSNWWDATLIIFNAFLFFIWSKTLLKVTFISDFMGFYAVFLALIYIYLGKMAYRLFKQDRLQVYILFMISFVLITIAIPLQFTGVVIGFAWFAQAIALVFIARKLKAKAAGYYGLVVLILGLISTFAQMEELMSHNIFFFNVYSLLLISSLIAIGLIIKLFGGMDNKNLFKINISSILKGMFLIQVFITLTVENMHFFTMNYTQFFLSLEQLSLSALWIIYAIVIFTFGIRKNNRYLRYASLGLLGIIIVKAFFIDLASLKTILKILLFILLGLTLLAISYFYHKKKDTIQGREETL